MSACNFNSMYEKATDMPKGEWNKKQTVKFDIPVTDTINGYDIYLNVRNTNDYPYSNFFAFITLTSPKGKSINDTLELTLADEKGKWLGHGFSGLWTNKLLYKKEARFRIPGIYTIHIEQGMRDEVLRGIEDVGIRIEPSK
jgi:gliding motility-associated lipoprotein GldH